MLIKDLEKRGARKQSLMFLSGIGGSGKSYTIYTIERYCHLFCQFVSIPYEKQTIYLTTMTGSTAILIKGITLHSATNFEGSKRKITDLDR